MTYPYKRLRLPDGSRIDEHRYVMQQYLGRKLDISEVVHHCNGDTRDNRIDNLELMLRYSHASLHTKGKPSPYKGKRTIKHGTTSMYRYGCRCFYCKIASPHSLS